MNFDAHQITPDVFKRVQNLVASKSASFDLKVKFFFYIFLNLKIIYLRMLNVLHLQLHHWLVG